MSGVVPQVAAMLGHCAAGTAYIPALADFIPMVKGTSSMALGGRHLVRAATGEEVTEEEMGGSEVHTKVSGVADLEVGSRRGVPGRRAPVPRRSSRPTTRSRRRSRATTDPVDRRVEELYKIVPTAPRRAYDMTKVVPMLSSTTASSSRSSRRSPATSSPGSARVGGHARRHRGQPARWCSVARST